MKQEAFGGSGGGKVPATLPSLLHVDAMRFRGGDSNHELKPSLCPGLVIRGREREQSQEMRLSTSMEETRVNYNKNIVYGAIEIWSY